MCEHDSANPALKPRQWADKIFPSLSVIILKKITHKLQKNELWKILN